MNRKSLTYNITLVLLTFVIAGMGYYFFLNRDTPPLESTLNLMTGLFGKNYGIQPDGSLKLGGSVNFRIVSTNNRKIYSAGPVVTFTLHKPDGSTIETKRKLNYFTPGAEASCPNVPNAVCSERGWWSAGTSITFGDLAYYDQTGIYKITASGWNVREAVFEVKDLELGHLLIDVNGYEKTSIGEAIADGRVTLVSSINTTYQGIEDSAVTVGVFAGTSIENAKKNFDSIAKQYPKTNFEGQTIAVYEYFVSWISGMYAIQVSTQNNNKTTSEEDILRAYLKKYPSSLLPQ